MEKGSYLVTVSVLHMDEYYRADYWPAEGSKIQVAYTGSTAGGSVANTSFVCTALGMRVCFYDVMSTSAQNHSLLKEMEDHGIDVSNVNFVEGLTDAKCIIVSTPKDRTILSVRFPRPPVALNPQQRRLFENAGYIYTLMGRQTLIPDYNETFSRFRQSGAKLVLDVEAAWTDPDHKKFMESADILFFNQFGFSENCGQYTDDEYVGYLFSKGVGMVVQTLGKNGCRVRTPRVDFSQPAYDIPVVDANGAGDTFNGAFLYGLQQQWDLEDTARFAIAAANYAVTQPGPRGGAAEINTILDFMAQHGISFAPARNR